MGVNMKKSQQGSGGVVAQQTMGHGSENVGVRSTKPATKPIDARWQSWRSPEDLASKHPMGRGVIAAAAEAMKKPKT